MPKCAPRGPKGVKVVLRCVSVTLIGNTRMVGSRLWREGGASKSRRAQGMVELAKSEFTTIVQFRGSEFDKVRTRVQGSPLQGMGV